MAKYKDQPLQAVVLMQLGVVDMDEHRYNEDQQHLMAVRKIYQSVHDQSSEAAALSDFGWIAERKGE